MLMAPRTPPRLLNNVDQNFWPLFVRDDVWPVSRVLTPDAYTLTPGDRLRAKWKLISPLSTLAE